MISSAELQRCYIDVYKELRKYIWSFEVVNQLVDVEIETFKAFPDMINLKKLFDLLKSSTESVVKDDEALNKAMKAFEDKIDVEDTMYYLVEQVKEVVTDEDIEE